MKTYFVQLVNRLFDKNQVLLSGAVIAEDREEAERRAIEIAGTYKAITEMDTELSVYTVIEITEESPAQFRVEQRIG